jgi:hypothetical protein
VRVCMIAEVRAYVREGVGVCLYECSFNYPGCKKHVQYFHLRSLWPNHIFLPYLTNDPILGKNLKCVL